MPGALSRALKLGWMLALVCSSITLCPATARGEGEARVKVDMRARVATGGRGGFRPHLDLMVRFEERFRARGFVQLKDFVGVRVSSSRWLTFQVYYANKTLMYSTPRRAHMVVGEVILSARLGAFRLTDRNGHELHVTDGFYRYRQRLEVLYQTPLEWLAIWIADELRIDSDQRRINLNDLQVGLELRPVPRIVLRLYYDLETKRRNRPEWEHTHVGGLIFGLRL